MKKRIFPLIFPLIALILEILPYGAVLRFANFEGEAIRETYSYFSLMPYGYANFAPLITALLTCVILCLAGLYAVNKSKKICIAVAVVSAVACIISLGPIVMALYSFVGAVITLTLAASAFVSFFIQSKN